jgi:hypothetical protein
MIRLIATDLDSTFYIPKMGIPASAWAAMEKAKAAGIKLAVCTGRPLGGYGLEWALALEPDGIHAFANGSLISRGAKLVDHTPLVPATHRHMVEASRSKGLPFYVTGASGQLYAENPPPRLSHFAELMGVDYRQEDLLGLSEPSVGGAYVVSAPLWAGIEAQMRGIPGLDWLIYTTDEDTVVAVADPAGISKATALEWMAQHYGIGVEEICMIGDSQNDLQAIKRAGLGIAVGNARSDIKAVADAVVGDIEQDGFAEAVGLALLG